MKSFIPQVAEFHRAFQQHQPERIVPYLGCAATNKLRIELLREELHELREGIQNNDRLEILDALCDSQYVLSGAVLAWGFKNIYDEANVMFRLVKIPDTDAHLAAMFGLLAQMEIAADGDLQHQVLECLRGYQSRLAQFVYHFGFAPVFNDAFAAVHANNMEKLWTEQEMDDRIIDSALGCAEHLTFTESPSGNYIARNNLGKAIKPARHTKVDLAKFI